MLTQLELRVSQRSDQTLTSFLATNTKQDVGWKTGRIVWTRIHFIVYLFTLFAATFTQNVVRYMHPNWLFNIRQESWFFLLKSNILKPLMFQFTMQNDT